MKWLRGFHKPFKTKQRADRQYVTGDDISGSWGAGATQEDSIADYLSMLAREYDWYVQNGDRLSPGLAARFKAITRFFGGAEPMPKTRRGVSLCTKWSPFSFRN